MAYAIDLNARQSTRTLEQAVRHRAQILLQPRVRPEDDVIACQTVAIDTPAVWRTRRSCLVLVPEDAIVVDVQPFSPEASDAGPSPATADAYKDLVGTYCDITLNLGESRYLFCADVVTVVDSPSARGPVRIYVARPETLQVAQRRRFWRFGLAQSSRVELKWTNVDESVGEGIGWLCNVSGDGLACRADTRIADQMGIGEQLRIEFALTPGDPQRFALDGILCNKTPAGTEGTMILGFQFLPEQTQPESVEAANDLRQQLLARYTPAVDPYRGADR